MRYAVLLLLLFACHAPGEPDSAAKESASSVASEVAGMSAVDGFVPMYDDADGGRVLALLPPEGEPFLYLVSLPHGLGSNDVGLDRGQFGDTRLLETRRYGNRVMLVEPNPTWRSTSPEPAVREAARESFAESVIFGFDVLAEENGRALVDATPFVVRDAHRVAGKLANTGQGRFSLERSRSAALASEARGFPKNSHVDALLTFTGSDPGREVRSTAPDPRSVTLRVRHAFVALPDDGYRPRRFHPKSGFFSTSFNDTAAPVDEPLTQRFLERHRLEKRDPSQPESPPIEPIVYYVDRGAPEPVRTALLEGARYWEPVFEAAGFPGGYRVELLPEGADPHDVRYNVVQWVNRSTRGWSYGNTISDPRTGEILKGHVTLGALRVRQDVLLAEGLLSPYVDGDDPRPIEMALARIRQLSAHEIGHTLGIAHNFAASTDGRASVMDYPAPVVSILEDGTLDLSDAYRDGCGEWDEIAVRYGYSDFDWMDAQDPATAEALGLARVLADAEAANLDYMTDADARGSDRGHPLANLWDNGADPVEYLEHAIEVRRIALENLSSNALKVGRPISDLEEVLVPLYLHHRFQLEACVRSLGGATYDYSLREPGPPASGLIEVVPAERQLRALQLALQTLEPEFLLPAGLDIEILPKPPGSSDTRERFRQGALTVDPFGAAAASMDLTLGFLLDPVRASRLIDQKFVDPSLPGFEDVLSRVLLVAYPESEPRPDAAVLRAELASLVADRLMRLSNSSRASGRVRDVAHRTLVRELLSREEEDSRLAGRIRRFLEDPDSVVGELTSPRIPPGSPIGCGFVEDVAR